MPGGDKKFAIFLRENIVGDDGNVHSVSEFQAKGQHERSLAAADWTANTHREGAVRQVAIERLFTILKMSGVR